MTAPRIDTVRNQLDDLIALAQKLKANLDDLHVLAYDRRRGRPDRPKVRGGVRDYALDDHGDLEARRILDDLKIAASKACGDFFEAVTPAVVYLRDGARTPRTPRSINSAELKAALEAQERRRARGEYVPNRTYPQPEPGT